MVAKNFFQSPPHPIFYNLFMNCTKFIEVLYSCPLKYTKKGKE